MNIAKKLLSLFKNGDNKNLSLNMIYTLIIKGFAMVISVLIVPAYVRYFSNESAYGAWVTVSAVFTWITMFDFGIGNGLRNHLVKTIAAKDDAGSKRYISSAYVSIGVISVVIWVVGALVIGLIDWNALLKIPAELVSLRTFKIYIEIVFLGVVIHFFFLLVSAICYAIQKTFLPNLITLITQIMLLAYILIPNSGTLETKILELSGVYLIAYNLPIFVVTIIVFASQLKKVRPNLRCFERSAAREIMDLGGRFFLIQLALVALSSSNEIYINLFFNSANVAEYHHYHKLFYVIIVFLTLIQQPIWSAATKAYYEKRYKWLGNLWNILAVANIFGVIGCVVLALIYQPVADIWLGKGELEVKAFTAAMFAFITAQTLIINMANCFSNGLGKLKSQTVCTVIGAIIKLPAAFIAVRIFNDWTAIIVATAVAQLPLFICQPLVMGRYIRRLVLKEAQNEISQEK